MFERQKLDPKRIPEVVKHKWGAKVLDEGFIALPKRLLRCLPEVIQGPHALEHLAVILAVVDYKRPKQVRPPSVDYLAFIAGMPAEMFKERLKELEAKQWLITNGTDADLDVKIEPFVEEVMKLTQDE